MFSVSHGNLNGYLQHLIRRGRRHEIMINVNSTAHDYLNKDFILDVDNTSSRWANDNTEKYPKCQIVLNRTYLQITHYSVRSYSPPEYSDFYFDSWNFTASINDDENISLLDAVWESDKLSNSQVYSNEINKEKRLFNSFTIQMTSLNAANDWHMRITAIELFGTAFEIPKNTPHCHQKYQFHPFSFILFFIGS